MTGYGGRPNLRENRPHTHQVNIELQALLRISDSYHGMVELISDRRIIRGYTRVCVESTRTKRPIRKWRHFGAGAGGVFHLVLNGECHRNTLIKYISSER